MLSLLSFCFRPAAGTALLLGAALLAAPAARAQSRDNSRPASLRGATPAAPPPTPEARGSLTAALGVGNNSSFFGRTQTTAYPYATGELTYTSPTGVWASVLAYNLFDTAVFLDETDLSVGWDHDLSKKVDVSASYSHFFFPANSPLVKASVNNSLDGSVGLDWGYVYSRLNGSYLFGNGTGDFFLTLDNSRNFTFDEVLAADDYLEFVPRLSFTAGTQYFAETSVQLQLKNGKPPKKPTAAAPATASRFSLLSYELRLPLTYTLGKVSGGVAYRYLVPVNLLADDDSVARSYFTASLSVTL
jgi:hypothetical protein